jgi:exopolysaccharide biosynthesis polyprenyl glycosylphosphotransferase
MTYLWRHVFLRSIALAFAIDVLALACVAAVVHGLFLLGSASPHTLVVASVTLLAGVPALGYAHAYDVPQLRDPIRGVLSVVKVGTFALLLIAAGSALGWIGDPLLRPVVAAVGLGLPVLGAIHWYIPRILPRIRRPERVLVVGTDELAARIGHHLRHARRLGVELMGFVGSPVGSRLQVVTGAEPMADTEELEKIVELHGVDRIVLAGSPLSESSRAELMRAWSRGVAVESGLAFYERLCGRLFLRSIDPQVFAAEAPLTARRVGDRLKRAVDLVGAGVGLLVTAPLLAVACLAIVLDSRGGPLFVQDRIGLHGRSFRLYKLRSMVAGAERGGARWTGTDDARITRVGRLLRRTRIDELPQLWNILRGEMSLVGPRPERPEFAEELVRTYPYFELRSMVKPGLTGWAQVRQGYVNEVQAWENKLELDLYYVKHRSLGLDVLILAETVRTLLLMRGM